MSRQDRVEWVTACRLAVSGEGWPFADAAEAEVAAHWARRSAESDKLFNGQIVLATGYDLRDRRFSAKFITTEFRKFLYWREHASPDTGVFDTFGTALIVSSEGDAILGRQRPGNINAGLAYPPGGFIDRRDLAASGEIDIDASIAREITEETGIDAAVLSREPGYLLTFTGQQISIAAVFRCPWTSSETQNRIRAHIATEADPELEEIVVVTETTDLDKLAMPHYARVLLGAYFGRATTSGD